MDDNKKDEQDKNFNPEDSQENQDNFTEENPSNTETSPEDEIGYSAEKTVTEKNVFNKETTTNKNNEVNKVTETNVVNRETITTLTDPQDVSKKPKFSKKKLLIIATIFILIGAGVAAYFLIYKKDTKTQAGNNGSTSQNASNNDSQTTADKKLIPDTIAYAFSAKSGDPYGIFWRPASSGERTDAKLSYRNVSQGTAYGQNVAFWASEGTDTSSKEVVLLSTDGGKTYKKIYESTMTPAGSNPADQVTSFKFSDDGSKLALAVFSSAKSTLYEVDLSNSEKKELFSAEEGAIFVHAYSSQKNAVVYTQGCYGCDGNLGNEIMYMDIASNTKRSLAKSSDTEIVSPLAVNSDFTELLIQSDTKDDSISPSGFFGFYLGPPYKLKSVKLNDSSVKEIVTFGEKLALSADGSVPFVFKAGGYMSDGKTPYYAYDKKVFGLSDPSSPMLLLETETSLNSLVHVGEEAVIGSTGDFNNYNLFNYAVKDKKSTNILNGDGNTIIFGVTTK